MSGIAGMLYPDVFQINHLVSPMLETLDHRGKGVRDVHTYRNIQLGSCGKKLAFNSKKTIFCAFDGFLSNRRFLTKELLNQGINLPENHSDSDIIVGCYEVYGESFPEFLNGNFAIAIFDQSEGQFILVRDRAGVKPLYWYHHKNQFIFASELKAILYTGAVPQTLALDALSTYLYFGYLPQDLTPIQGINKLLPGYTLIYNMQQSMRIEPYWSLSAFFQSTHKENPQTLIHELDFLIKTAVRNRIPDEPVIGCLVSGGIGSASTALYVQKSAGDKQVEAITGGFSSYNDADIDAAKEVALSLSIPQRITVLDPADLVKNLSQIIWYLDEPNADPNVVTTWHLAASATQTTHTVFSGMGSDELLAGHSRYTFAEREISPIQAQMLEFLKKAKPYLLPLFRYLWNPFALKLLKETRTDPWQLAHMQRYAIFDLNTLKQAAPNLSGMFDPQVFLHKFHHLHRINNKVGQLLYLDIKTRLADNYCHQYERMCTAHGVVWQTPFLDRDLMEFSAGIPEPDALTEIETASLLKDLLKNNYSTKFLNRPKRTRQGFLGDWASLPPILELFHRLPHGTLVETGIISEKWIRNVIRNINEKPQAFKYLWSILVLETWVQMFVNRRIESRPPYETAQNLIGHAIHLHD